jgi:hypothetical protein
MVQEAAGVYIKPAPHRRSLSFPQSTSCRPIPLLVPIHNHQRAMLPLDRRAADAQVRDAVDSHAAQRNKTHTPGG